MFSIFDRIDMQKAKYVLPSLFTSASLMFSFLAIVSAFHSNFTYSAVYMLLSGFADAFDGRVARLTDTQTEFGAALDSLADVVSFGATPALVLYCWSLESLGHIGAGISFLYLLSVALRLAKFDTQPPLKDITEEQKIERKLYFYGLPCPAAAVTISGLVWMGDTYFANLEILKIILSLFLVIYLATMMISDVKFRSFKDSDGKGNTSRLFILSFVLMLIMLFTIPQLFMFPVMFCYIISGPISTYKYSKTKIS